MSRLLRHVEDGAPHRYALLIITHHFVTMSRMDRLYGVTMGE
jgi:chromosome segregation ATPase